MKYAVAALIGAFCLSISDLCSNYALEHGLTNLRHCFWSHGVVYALAIALAVWFVSERGGIISNIAFPEDKRAGFASIVAGCFGFLALLVINYAFSHSKNIGYTVGLLSTTSIITLLLSVAISKKPLQGRGAVGVCVTFIGIWLVSGCENDR